MIHYMDDPTGTVLCDGSRTPLFASAVRVTDHAIERYRQRVEPGTSSLMARLRLEQMVAVGRTRSTPRYWMRGYLAPTPGLRFLYCAQRPNVCALLVRNSVVTVLTRSMFSGRGSLERPRPAGRPRALDPCHWRWNGQVVDEFEIA